MSKLPLVTSDTIERYGVPWANVDNYGAKLRDGEPLIINTDLSSGEGIHWMCAMPIGDTLFVVDSLGADNVRPHDDLMFDIARRAGLTPQFYRGRFQYADNSNCGWFALYIAKMLQKMKHPSIASATSAIARVFGRSADDGDLRVIRDAFHL